MYLLKKYDKWNTVYCLFATVLFSQKKGSLKMTSSNRNVQFYHVCNGN